jgi:glycerol-3-phosphate O-acyltransferase
VYPEGRLTRDGRLLEARLGVLDYMLREFDPQTDRDIVFIPVGINYDRTLEDRSLLRSLDPAAEKRSFWFVLRTTTVFVLRSFTLMALSRWQRYGYAGVNFGRPLSVKAYCREHGVVFSRLAREARFPEIKKLGETIMAAIAEVVPVLPVAVVSAVLLDAGAAGLDILGIEAHSNRLVDDLHARGAPVLEAPRTKRAHAYAGAIDLLQLRGVVREDNNRFRIVPGEEPLLRYYANAIVHYRQGNRT